MATLLNETSNQNEIPNTIESMISQLFIKENKIENDSSCSETDIKLDDLNDDYDSQTEDTESQQSFFLRPKGETKPQTMKGNNTFFEKNSSDFTFQRMEAKKVYKTTCINVNNINNKQQFILDAFNNGDNNINKVKFNKNNNYKRNIHQKRTFDMTNQLQNSCVIINNQQQQPKQLCNNNFQLEIETLIYEIEKQLTNSNCISFSLYQTILPNFIQMIKTQRGSRVLQNYLSKTSLPILNNIYTFISPYLHILLFDSYANYFCLKLFYCLGPTERLSYLNQISPYLLNLSINKVATYPVQCIIANLITHKEKEIVINAINSNVDKLSFDIYGTHVVEKVLLCLDPSYAQHIIQFILDNFIALACHVNGLCVAKRILTLSAQTGLYRNELIYILNTSCVSLIQNPYGNYALQVVIDQWNESSTISVISPLLSHIAELSLMKYSSNVIERCLEKVPWFLYEFIKETCGTPGIIGQLIKSSYGNYVVQTALRISPNELKVKLINCIQDNFNVLEEKKLVAKWKSILAANIFECLSNNNNNNNNNHSINMYQ